MIVPVILAGGIGSRLWPLSRACFPKQFVSGLVGDGDDRSLFQATLSRLPVADNCKAPIIICNELHRFLVRDQLSAEFAEVAHIVLEPEGRNTAPAIAVAALIAQREHGDDAIIVAQPADHLIRNTEAFCDAVRQASQIATDGWLTLFGMPALKPHTGYGYIRKGEALPGTEETAFRVDAFMEKPDEATARKYVEDGNYYWNSGIFVLPVGHLLKEMEELQPEIMDAARAALDHAEKDLEFLRLDSAAFLRAPNISFDHALMEKTETAAMLTPEMDWCDLGTWQSLWENAVKDDHGNALVSDVQALLNDASGCYVRSDGKRLVSLLGVQDMVVVDTPDTLLIANRERAEQVSGIVKQLSSSKRSEHFRHVRDYRPWGWFEPLNEGPRYQVKILHIKPGERLSLQMHHHRSEHWIVVRGTAKVTIDDEEHFLCENESIYISPTQWHRLENPGKEPLTIIEVQIGSYLGEDDIVRAEDDYNRASNVSS